MALVTGNLEKESATYSSILAWRTPGTGEPGGLQSMGLQRIGHNWATKHTHDFHPISNLKDQLSLTGNVLNCIWKDFDQYHSVLSTITDSDKTSWFEEEE